MERTKECPQIKQLRFGSGPSRISIRETLKETALKTASNISVVINNALGERYKDRFGILMYHRVAEQSPGVPIPTTNVTALQLRRQLTGLLQRGFVFWPLRKLIEFRNHGWQIPTFVASITFDDGFSGVYHNAWPILREFNLPATVFLNTAYLDSLEPMPFDHWAVAFGEGATPDAYRALTTEQCLEMAATGLVEFGSHTHTHEDFRNRSQALEKDLRISIERLGSIFGKTDVTFAFPYGIPKLGFADATLVNAAKGTGVICALNTGSDVITPECDPFHWGRFNVFSWDNSATLAAKLNGWYSWAPHTWKRLTKGLSRSHGPTKSYMYCDNTVLSSENSSIGSTLSSQLDSVSNTGGYNSRPLDNKDFISVIVPTYNRAYWLGDAIESLINQETGHEFQYEILIVDNCSTDDTPQVVSRYTANTQVSIRYLYNSVQGDAPTRNFGLEHALGNWIAFFDDDQLAASNWLYELWRAARKLDTLIVGGRVLLDLPEQKLLELGPFCREVLREVDYYDYFHPYTGSQLPGTCNAMVFRDVFNRLGMFDETMYAGGSDHVFFFRARKAGIALWYTPHAVIHHRFQENRLTPQYFRWEALSGGAGHAKYFDFKYKGPFSLFFLCGARLAQAMIQHVPLMIFAWLKGNKGGVLGRKVRIWRVVGYARMTLALLFPRLFLQRRFFDAFEFRIGRKIGLPNELKFDSVTEKRKSS